MSERRAHRGRGSRTPGPRPRIRHLTGLPSTGAPRAVALLVVVLTACAGAEARARSPMRRRPSPRRRSSVADAGPLAAHAAHAHRPEPHPARSAGQRSTLLAAISSPLFPDGTVTGTTTAAPRHSGCAGRRRPGDVRQPMGAGGGRRPASSTPSRRPTPPATSSRRRTPPASACTS